MPQFKYPHRSAADLDCQVARATGRRTFVKAIVAAVAAAGASVITPHTASAVAHNKRAQRDALIPPPPDDLQDMSAAFVMANEDKPPRAYFLTRHATLYIRDLVDGTWTTPLGARDVPIIKRWRGYAALANTTANAAIVVDGLPWFITQTGTRRQLLAPNKHATEDNWFTLEPQTKPISALLVNLPPEAKELTEAAVLPGTPTKAVVFKDTNYWLVDIRQGSGDPHPDVQQLPFTVNAAFSITTNTSQPLFLQDTDSNWHTIKPPYTPVDPVTGGTHWDQFKLQPTEQA